MSLLEIQILITALVVLWFDIFVIDTKIKKLFGFKPWVKKMDLPFLLRWVGCYFCTSWWIGVITISILYYLFDLSIYDGSISILFNLIVSKFIDQQYAKK